MTQMAATVSLAGDWKVRVQVRRNGDAADKTLIQEIDVAPPELIQVQDERYESLPLFDPNAWGGWLKGVVLHGVRAGECGACSALDPATLVVRSCPGATVPLFVRGRDYEADLDWGTIGRLAQGRIGEKQPVGVSYGYAKLRIDSIVLTRQGRISLRKGEPHISLPHPPALSPAETVLANIWIKGRLPRLTADNLFPVLETAYPEPASAPGPTAAARLTPNALRKLRNGQRLKILAWGDSVTDGYYLPTGTSTRWQAQFVAGLNQRFPKADIELVTEAWAGHNTDNYLAEPPGSEHHYQEKVLGVRPDLVVSEFVNDAGMGAKKVADQYGRFLADFRAIGAEWIILTPHYVRPDWMGLSREREIDDDPRPYVTALREFSARHGVALADASLRYGQLWRQGIPYTCLLHNTINHPDERGLRIFADCLLALFPDG